MARTYFGAERVGPVGKFGPDVVTEMFSVECRQRKTITYSELESWAAEVRRECAGRVPVLAVRRPRGRGHALAPTLFVLDEKAWLDLHGPESSMTVHIELIPSRTLCGQDGKRITLRFIVEHFALAALLMRREGCRECGEKLTAALRDARPIT